MVMRFAICALLMPTLTAPALADVVVEFVEGAPKDRFEITNLGVCPLAAPRVAIDLSGSAAGLIFDTTGSGAGVQVFQAFEVVAGGDLLVASNPVADGDERIVLDLSGLDAGQSFAFTIDVDDTTGISESTVSQSETSGASVSVEIGSSAFGGTFDSESSARVAINNCTS